MELHPILESGACPNPGLWYVLAGRGEMPSMRVGHTAMFVPASDSRCNGRLLVVGGANPDGTFADTYVLDLESFTWDRWDLAGMKARYEHAVFNPACHPNKLYVFGGADQGGQHNDIQVLDVKQKSWSTLCPGGMPPSGRTLHVSASVGNQFFVYSGGQCGSEPVGDRQVHCYDAFKNEWLVLNVRGEPPKPRLGHIMVAVDGKLLLHGGMAGSTFYDDLYILDPAVPSWSRIKQKRTHPSPRAGHAAVAKGHHVYIFGGMNHQGALDEMYKLDTTSMQWSRLCLAGPPPACRLDFAMCLISLRVTQEGSHEGLGVYRGQAKEVLDNQLHLGSAGSGHSAGSDGSQHSLTSYATELKGPSEFPEPEPNHGQNNGAVGSADQNGECAAQAQEGAGQVSNSEAKLVDLCVILGGMDTEGEIFDDTLAILLN